MGLPYVSDPAITRHLGRFSQATSGRRASRSASPGRDSLQRRRLSAGRRCGTASSRSCIDWYDKPEQPWQPLVLTNPSLDLAVAWGAAYYAWLRHSGGRRIGGGIARSYYVAVEAQAPQTERRADRPLRRAAAARRRAGNHAAKSRNWNWRSASR